MRIPAFFFTILVACTPAVAQAAEPPCLTPREFASVATYALPSAITGTANRCAASLGAGSWLARNAPALAARYGADRQTHWPAAKAAFMKLSAAGGPSAGGMLKSLPDASMQQMFDLVVQGMVAQEIPTERCGTIDRFVRLLSPLPAGSVAELIGLTVGLADKSGQAKVGQFSLCRT